jgi:hypothetical protein
MASSCLGRQSVAQLIIGACWLELNNWHDGSSSSSCSWDHTCGTNPASIPPRAVDTQTCSGLATLCHETQTSAVLVQLGMFAFGTAGAGGVGSWCQSN